MAPFYGWGSTTSRLEPLQGGSLFFTTKFPEIPGTFNFFWYFLYTFIRGFPPHQLSCSSIHVLTCEKHEISKWTVQYMLKVIVRDTTKPLIKQL